MRNGLLKTDQDQRISKSTQYKISIFKFNYFFRSFCLVCSTSNGWCEVPRIESKFVQDKKENPLLLYQSLWLEPIRGQIERANMLYWSDPAFLHHTIHWFRGLASPHAQQTSRSLTHTILSMHHAPVSMADQANFIEIREGVWFTR